MVKQRSAKQSLFLQHFHNSLDLAQMVDFSVVHTQRSSISVEVPLHDPSTISKAV